VHFGVADLQWRAMSARWLAVILTAAAFVAAPLLMSARPATPSDISATELAGRVWESAGVGWSGYVETSGTLQVPDDESFATLAQMLGEKTQLRVGWRNGDDWRVDRIRLLARPTCFASRDTPFAGSSNGRPQPSHRFPRFGCPTAA
jgi:hypothetical protein